MKPKIWFAIIALSLAMIFAGFTYGGGPGGGMGGGGMGRGGSGMMGGGHMMGYGRDYSATYQDQYSRSDERYQYGPRDTERLRLEICERRQELSALYRAEKPDKDLINKKINELDKLEAELDHRLSGPEFQRR